MISMIVTSAFFFTNIAHVRLILDMYFILTLWIWWNECGLLVCGWVWGAIAKMGSGKHSFLLSLLDVRAAREQINLGGVTYPTLSLQDAGPRPQSMYGQASVACSPTVAFARPLPPQPHSSYFSGMTGPQHPFYNRVRQEVDTCHSDKKMDQPDSLMNTTTNHFCFVLCIWPPV